VMKLIEPWKGAKGGKTLVNEGKSQKGRLRIKRKGSEEKGQKKDTKRGALKKKGGSLEKQETRKKGLDGRWFEKKSTAQGGYDK